MGQIVFDDDLGGELEALYRTRDIVRRRKLIRAALSARPGERILDVAERLQHRRAIAQICLLAVFLARLHGRLAAAPVEQWELRRTGRGQLQAVAREQIAERGRDQLAHAGQAELGIHVRHRDADIRGRSR